MEGEGTQQGVMGGWYGHAGWVPSPPCKAQPLLALYLPSTPSKPTAAAASPKAYASLLVCPPSSHRCPW